MAYRVSRSLIFYFILFLLCSVLYLCLNTPFLTINIIKGYVKKNYPQYTLKDLKIKKQQVLSLNTIYLEGISASVVSGKETYHFSNGNLIIEGLSSLVAHNKEFQITSQIPGVYAKAGHGEDIVVQMKMKAEGTHVKVDGNIWVQSAEVALGMLKNISAQITATQEDLQLRNILAYGYGGTIQGNIFLKLIPVLSYNVSIAFNDLNTHALEKVNAAVFSNIEGKLKGSSFIEGRENRLQNVSLEASLGQGKIKASLLGLLVNQVPDLLLSAEKRALLETDKMIPVSQGDILLKSVNSRAIEGRITIKCPEINMNFDLPLNINLDGNLNDILHYWQQIS